MPRGITKLVISSQEQGGLFGEPPAAQAATFHPKSVPQAAASKRSTCAACRTLHTAQPTCLHLE